MGKQKRSSKQIMAETFVLVSFSFVGGTFLAGGFLWFLTQEVITSGGHGLNQESAVIVNEVEKDIEVEVVVENDSRLDLVEDSALDLEEYAIRLEDAVSIYISDNEDLLPESLEILFPEYIESIDEVGGDLTAFEYIAESDVFEINVSLGESAIVLMEDDGGNNDNLFELGTDLTLLP